MKRDVRAFISFIWKSNRALILFGMAFVASVQLLLIYFNSTLDIAPMMEVFMAQLPPQMKEMFGEEVMSQISAEGTIAFGLEHPLVITLFTFISISVVTRNIASGPGNQLMEIILAHPVKRKVMLNSLYFFAFLAILLLVLSTFFGAFFAVVFFHEMDQTILERMIQANVNAFLLHGFVLSFTLFFSVFLKDISGAVRFSALLVLVFYFVDILADLWDVFEFTKLFNFFAFFDPPEIMIGHEFVYRDMFILLAGSVILYWVSRRIFLRKDIF